MSRTWIVALSAIAIGVLVCWASVESGSASKTLTHNDSLLQVSLMLSKLTDSETLTASKAVGVDFDECLWESTLTSLWESTFTNIVYNGTSTG